MKYAMFYSIQMLNRSTISINDFNPRVSFFFSLKNNDNKKIVLEAGSIISSLIFGCDDPNYNPSPVKESSLLT